MIKRFNIKWLNRETTKIKEIKKNSMIKIIEGTKELILKIVPEERQAILSEDENEIITFDIYEKRKSVYHITIFRFEIVDENDSSYNDNEFNQDNIQELLLSSIYMLDNNIRKHLNEFCLNIIDFRLDPYYNKNDLQLLSKDEHFQDSLKKLKEYIDTSYYKFLNLEDQK